jgi:hypothetical protein
MATPHLSPVGLKHEEMFADRYCSLLQWARQVTGGDIALAQDLVHDAYVQFVLARPDLGNIQSLDRYQAWTDRAVFYILKENRTYDQLFGDIRQGNGSPELTLFGGDVTPNHHKLANEFILYDNFFVDGDVSADGHFWSMAAASSDYVNKFWPRSMPPNLAKVLESPVQPRHCCRTASNLPKANHLQPTSEAPPKTTDRSKGSM